MKKLTKEQVMVALQEYQSLETDYDKNYYWLHVTEDGEIVSNRYAADANFRVEVDIPEKYLKDVGPDWYDHEDESNPIFMEAVEKLTQLANDWL